MENRELKLAEEIRKRCIDAAREGFQDASMSGLCLDGSMEAANSGIQNIDLNKLIENYHKNVP